MQAGLMQMTGQPIAEQRQLREAEIALTAVAAAPAQRQLLGTAGIEMSFGQIRETQICRLR